MAGEQGKQEQVQTLESGDIFFLYQPRIEEEHPESLGEVQRLYVVLSPEKKKRHRLLVIGHKKLPEPSHKGSQLWGFVDETSDDPQNITRDLQAETHKTKTRGEQHTPSARPVGEGVYRILQHGDHTHLVYTLELPEKPEEVQEAFNLENEGSYILNIKNPERSSPQAAGLSEEKQAKYPQRLQEIFHDRKFAEANPPDFLDYTGTEFLLVSASEEISEELGIELNAEREKASTADVFREMKMEKSEHPIAPLLQGQWE